MVVTQGDVCWADLPVPVGSSPGFRRPLVVIQGNALNRSAIQTVICVPLTRNARWANALGNVFLSATSTGLAEDSVANVSGILAVDRSLLEDRVGHLARRDVDRILDGIDVVLGR